MGFDLAHGHLYPHSHISVYTHDILQGEFVTFVLLLTQKLLHSLLTVARYQSHSISKPPRAHFSIHGMQKNMNGAEASPHNNPPNKIRRQV